MAENAAALRAGSLDAVQLFQPYAEELIASGAGHVWYAAADRGLTAYTALVTRRPLLASRRDELLRMTRADRAHAALDGRDAGSRYRPRPGRLLPLGCARYLSLRRSTAIARANCSPPTRCCSARASIGCRRRCGPAARSTARSRSSACVDNSLAEQALADTRPCGDKAIRQHPPTGMPSGRTLMNRRQILTGLGSAALAAGPARAAEKPRWMSPQLPDGTREEATLEALPGKQKLIRLADRPPNYEAPIETFGTAITPERPVLRPLSSGRHPADGRPRQMVARSRRRRGGTADHAEPRRSAEEFRAGRGGRGVPVFRQSPRPVAAACRRRGMGLWRDGHARPGADRG